MRSCSRKCRGRVLDPSTALLNTPAAWAGRQAYLAGALAALHGAYHAALDPEHDGAALAFLEALLFVAEAGPVRA